MDPFPERAEAYIDPGTGSYVLQLLLAGILGALFALKVFWRTVSSSSRVCCSAEKFSGLDEPPGPSKLLSRPQRLSLPREGSFTAR